MTTERGSKTVRGGNLDEIREITGLSPETVIRCKDGTNLNLKRIESGSPPTELNPGIYTVCPVRGVVRTRDKENF
jgi:hypothetical protein